MATDKMNSFFREEGLLSKKKEGEERPVVRRELVIKAAWRRGKQSWRRGGQWEN